MKKWEKIFMSSLLVVSMIFMSIIPVFAYENSKISDIDDTGQISSSTIYSGWAGN